MSLASVTTLGYSLGNGIPGTLGLVTSLGYGLTGEAPPPPPPPPPDVRPHFGGGPFWRGRCNWDEEDERELRTLEKQERELETRLAKVQRTASRTEAVPESSSAAAQARIAKRREEQAQRIEELVARLDTVQRAIAEKEAEKEEADDFFDCVAAILMDEE